MIASGLIVALTVAGALLSVAQRNIVRSIFGLAIALLGVALAFLVLGSPFVAAMEVLIYIGGITVAMVFAVMLSSAGRLETEASVARRVIAAILALAFFSAIALVITSAEFASAPEMPAAIAAERWSVEELGRNLIDRFNVVFELLSIVLLVAILGAVTIASRVGDADDPPTGEEPNA